MVWGKLGAADTSEICPVTTISAKHRQPQGINRYGSFGTTSNCSTSTLSSNTPRTSLLSPNFPIAPIALSSIVSFPERCGCRRNQSTSVVFYVGENWPIIYERAVDAGWRSRKGLNWQNPTFDHPLKQETVVPFLRNCWMDPDFFSSIIWLGVLYSGKGGRLLVRSRPRSVEKVSNFKPLQHLSTLNQARQNKITNFCPVDNLIFNKLRIALSEAEGIQNLASPPTTGLWVVPTI